MRNNIENGIESVRKIIVPYLGKDILRAASVTALAVSLSSVPDAQASSRISLNSFDPEGRNSLFLDAPEQEDFPLTPTTVEIVTANGVGLEPMFYSDFSQMYPDRAALINEAIPLFMNYAQSEGINITSYAAVLQGVERDGQIEPTATPTPDTPDQFSFLFSHSDGGVYARYDSQSGEWWFAAYSNFDMLAGIVGSTDSLNTVLNDPEASARFALMYEPFYVIPGETDGLVVINRDTSLTITNGSLAEGGFVWEPRFTLDQNSFTLVAVESEALVFDLSLSVEEFVNRYEWQRDDVVNLVPTGMGGVEDVAEHWTLSVTRNGLTYNNIPVGAIQYGGRARALGIEEIQGEPRYLDVSEEYRYYIVNAMYLGYRQSIENVFGTQKTVYYLSLAIPSRDETQTLIVEALAPEDFLAGFSIGGGTVMFTPATEIFDQIDATIGFGTQIKVDLAQLPNTSPRSYAEWREVDCNTDLICQSITYAHDPVNATNPEVIFDWWMGSSLDEDEIVRDNGVITVGALGQVIIARSIGSVWQSN
jgi:hypothetical protein